MGAPKVVLDTNIIVSAFGWGGNPREVFNLCIFGKIELFSSSEQIAELQRVLCYPKFAFSSSQIEYIIRVVLDIVTFVELAGNFHVVTDDPSDDIILETAVRGGASYLVTRDEHLLKLKKFGDVTILKAVDFLLVVK